MGRRRAGSWRWRIWRWRLGAAILLMLLGAGGYIWWQSQQWAPSSSHFPVQGVLVGARDGSVDFNALRAIGASFVYLSSSSGEARRDAAFSRNLRRALASGLKVGAVHDFDPCVRAEHQAANFLTVVPRLGGLLPPVIALVETAEHCDDRLSEVALESELTTFLNQIESHAGHQAVLAISPEFEERHHIASRFERDLWLERDWLQPDYAGRPWTLWTANSARRTEAGALPLRWVVVQP